MKYLLSLLILLSSCGPTWHLKQAERHIRTAKIKGADVKSDTIYKKITFDVKGAKANFDLGPTILQRKDGVTNKYILKDTIIYKNRIKTEIRDNTVYVECPDEVVTKDVAVAVDTNISAGYTKWQVIYRATGVGLLALIIGFVLGKLLKIPLPFPFR